MVTVDPARDTPELLASYVASPAFPEGLRGLTGSPAQIEAATTAFKVYAQRRDDPGSAAGYVVDHSRLFYLMDRNWRPAAFFQDDLPPAAMAACIDHALAKAR
jgi:protein SCO1/2